MSRTDTDAGEGMELFEYEGDRIRFSHDMDGEVELGTAITTAIAFLTDQPEETVGPELADAVDFDALDRLFQHQSNVPRTGGHVVLTVADCSVTVESTGLVIVERRVE